MKTILLTSVGGRVGEDVLTLLEPLRDRLRVVGVNSIARASQNFRCDRTYLVSPTERREAWLAEMRAVLRTEQPDLVLPLRDGDLAPLAVLKADREFAATIFYSSDAAAVEVIVDKAQTAAFARSRGLAFAETATTTEELEALIRLRGFPLIGKPRSGTGTKGVRLLRSRGEADAALALTGYMVQEFIDPPPSISTAQLDLSAGLPFHFTLPGRSHISALAGIAADGAVAYSGTLDVGFVSEEIAGSTGHETPEIAALTLDWVRALAAIGARGIINVQCRKAADRGYVPFEINGRIPGGAVTRRQFNHDGFAGALVALFGTDPLRYPGDAVGRRKSERVLHVTMLDLSACERLEADRAWSRS